MPVGNLPAVFSGGSFSKADRGSAVSFIHKSISVGLRNLFRRPWVVGQALMISSTDSPWCSMATIIRGSGKGKQHGILLPLTLGYEITGTSGNLKGAGAT